MIAVFNPQNNSFTLYDPVSGESSYVDIEGLKRHQLEYVCYLLYNGGEVITDSITRIDGQTVRRIKDTIHLLPEHNQKTYQAVKKIYLDRPAIPHFLLCETGFFSRLPEEVTAYAVPVFLKKTGIKRFGSNSLFHEYMMQMLKEVVQNRANKIVSVYLGNSPHIAAIKDSRPVEMTTGFSSLEGLMSVNGCGDIDPTIIFDLYSKGMPFNEINILLSQKSGFSGLAGRECDFKQMLTEEDSKIIKLRKIFAYNVVRYIGAFISVMGGVDSIVFGCSRIETALSLIVEIISHFTFLNIEIDKSITINEHMKISTYNSMVDVYCFAYDRLKMIRKLATLSLEVERE